MDATTNTVPPGSSHKPFLANTLENQFLIATPSLEGSYFSQTVSVMCQHNEKGAIGLVINKLMPTSITEVFVQMNLPTQKLEAPDTLIGNGGPVQTEVGFVLHSPTEPWEATLDISDQLQLTSSRDILEAISKGEGPERYRFFLGYCGWGEGQIESELQENSWLNLPVDTRIVFETPAENVWSATTNQLGFDPRHLHTQVGHA